MKEKLIHSLGKLLPIVLFVVLFSGFSTPIFAEENAAEEDTVVEQQPVEDPSAEDATTDETESKATQDESNSQAEQQAQEDSKADDDVLNVNEATRNITTGTNVNGNETWSGETINVSGQGVIWPKGTLTIEDSTIINESIRSTGYGDRIAIVVQKTNGKLVLKGVIVEETSSARKKFVALQEGTKLEAIDTIFNVNRSSYDPLIWVTQGSTADFENVTFNGGDNLFDSALIKVGGTPSNANAQGGTVNFKGENKISNVRGLGNNYIDNNGTINIVNGTTVIENSVISLKNKGIVVKAGAILKLVNSYIRLNELGHNFAIKVEAGGTLIVDGSTITNATKSSGSDAAYIMTDGGTIELKKALIDNNKNGFDNGSQREGNIINVKNGVLKVEDSKITNNTTQVPGAIGLTNSTATFSNTEFTSNKAAFGGAINAKDSDVTITDCKFEENTVNRRGGAISMEGGTLTIDDNSTFNKNGFAGGTNESLGGALFLTDMSSVTIGKAQFNNNGLIDEEYGFRTMDGGAIYLNNIPNATFNGTQFKENRVWGYNLGSGGAVYANGASTVVNVNGAKFHDNYASIYGGGMSLKYGTAIFKDLDGDPTEFIGNQVEYAYDFAGGGLFINMGYAKMWDAAIYDNFAQHAGGGLATCTTGTAQVRVLDGAAIFNNGIDPESTYPSADVQSYQDIYFQTKDHTDATSGEPIPGRDSFPNYPVYIYERMFNGGLHNWNGQSFEGVNDDGLALNSYIATSNPTNTDISGAKVIFTKNTATAHPYDGYHAFGGGIGCNGLLEIGTGAEIKVVKVWDDNDNNDGARPSVEDFLKTIKIIDVNGEEIDKSTLEIDVIDANINDYMLANNVIDAQNDPKQYDDNAWLIIISGLPYHGEYTIEETGISKYQLVSNVGDAKSYYELTNEHANEMIEIRVRKVWNDNNDKHKVRPQSVTVRLYADGHEIDSIVLSAENNWQATFGELQKYIGGVEIEYTISEDAVEYYVTKITGSAEEGFTIENDVDSPEKPQKPEKPEEPKKPSKPEQPKIPGVSTGLESMISMYSMMTGISLMGAVAIKRKH